MAFSGCFSPWKGDEATLTLLFGNSPGGRAAATDEATPWLVLNIDLSCPTGRQSHTVEGNTFSVTVIPGYWKIRIQAFKDSELYAQGEGGAQIKAGRDNAVEIKMRLAGGEPNTGINIYFLNDELILDDESNNKEFTISTIGSAPHQFTAAVNGDFEDVQWLIWGFPVSDENTITINAEDYNPGTYRLTVIVIDDNKPYSAEIIFTVE